MDFLDLKLHLQVELTEIFQLLYGTITLVLDPETSPLLSCTVGMQFLLSNGVKQVFLLETTNDELNLPKSCTNVVYFLLPKERYVSQMCLQVNTHLENCTIEEKKNKSFSCFFIPRRTPHALSIIEKFGLHGRITSSSLDLSLVVLDDDVASLELSDFMSNTLVHNNRLAGIQRISESMVALQRVFGVFQAVYAKGSLSTAVASCVQKISRRDGLYADQAPKVKPNMDVFFLDRSLDMVTPFMTQLTFEGLIDEVLSIKCGMVSVPKETVDISDTPTNSQPSSPVKSKDINSNVNGNSNTKYALNSSDELYAKIKNKPFGEAISQLSNVTKYLKEQSSSNVSNTKTLTELAKFVAELPNLLSLKKSVTIFIRIASLLTEYVDSDTEFLRILRAEQELLTESRSFARDLVEELMLRCRSWESVIKVMVLYSIINQGVKESVYDFFRSEFLKTYGYDKVLILSTLERIGWLVSEKEYNNSSLKNFNFIKLKKTFRLISSFDNLEAPGDYSYTFSYSSYAPLSIRILESFFTSGFTEIDRSFPISFYPSSYSLNNKPIATTSMSNMSSFLEKRTWLIFFVGGVTFSELAALRFLAKRLNIKVLIGTTCIINGKTILDQLEFDVSGPESLTGKRV